MGAAAEAKLGPGSGRSIPAARRALAATKPPRYRCSIKESTVRSAGRGQRIYAYVGAAWAFLFAAMSFYWALGGSVGLSTLGEGIEEIADRRETADLVAVWLTGVLKLLAGAIALALLFPSGSKRLRRTWWLLAWLMGVFFALYGLANGVQHALMAAGTVEITRTLGSEAAVRWHLFLWDPFWVAGGLLFIEAARRTGRPG